MAAMRTLTAWCREHPVLADVPVAVVAFVVATVVRPPEDRRQLFPVADPWTTILVAAACLLLLLRRRYPLTVSASITAIGLVGAVAVGGVSPAMLPALVALYTICAWADRRVALLTAVATTVVLGFAPALSGPVQLASPVTYVLLSWGGMAAAIGIAVRSRREVLAAAEDRAVRAERGREEEAQRRVAEERLRIARDLHDVLAHQISVINVQAGVARHLLPTQPDAAGVALGHVRDATRIVLEEMPAILGLLRTTEDDLETAPAPGLAQIGLLVESMRRAGLEVTWQVLGEPVSLAPGADLAAYRLVQEALTNAHKHGAGRAEVTVAYTEGDVVLTVRNPMAAPAPTVHSGHGLVGMRERVAAIGGRLTTGPVGGSFVVTAELHRTGVPR